MRKLSDMFRFFTACGVGLLVFFVAGCHKPHRNNPLDPTLTPTVELLSATLDSVAGTITLAWTEYDGDQPFTAYRIFRAVKGLTAVDSLVTLHDRHQTTFQDTTVRPDMEYLYRVAVVNRAGLVAPSESVPMTSFRVSWDAMLEAHSDSLTGTVSMHWRRYRGPGFGYYQVSRSRLGTNVEVLQELHSPADTTFALVDTTSVPGSAHLYWVELMAAGQQRVSDRREVVYRLPSVELLRADFSSNTATAELEWTAYQGPRFEAYEVRRRSIGVEEQVVGELPDMLSTTFTDTLLDGNTDYTYRIFVRTAWGSGIGTFSSPRTGKLYSLREVRALAPKQWGGSLLPRPHAVDLALDEQDGLYIAVTAIQTTTSAQVYMQPGVQIRLPGTTGFRLLFEPFYPASIYPDRRSPIRVAVDPDKVCVTVGLDDGKVLVGAYKRDQDRLTNIWYAMIETGGEPPEGLYFESNRDVVMVDKRGMLHRLHAADGKQEEPDDRLQAHLTSERLPVRRVTMVPKGSSGDSDRFFGLLPEYGEHRVFIRKRIGQIIGGRDWIDEGVGAGDGQVLDPVTLAFDRWRDRLLVLEWHARLQVFDARPDVTRRYVTKWGRYGKEEGEFLISSPIGAAMVVDSQGMIYVADGSERIQVFGP